jgi:lysophospholipase L1-like esterase
MPRLKRVQLVATLGSVVVAIALLGGESLLRHRESRRPSIHGLLALRTHRNGRHQRTFTRGADHYGWAHINQYGFRGPDFERTKAAGTTRIVAVGASATFDACVFPDDAAWPARLQHWLGRLDPAHRFEVINAGMPGYVMADNIARLKTELPAFAPDVIVIYAGHGTVSHLDLPHENGDVDGAGWPAAAAEPAALAEWLGHHSLLYTKVAPRLRSLTRTGAARDTVPATDPRWEVALRTARERFRRDLGDFIRLAQGTGARVVVVELAHMNGAHSGEQLPAAEQTMWARAFDAPPAVVLQGYERFSAVQRAMSDSLGATFVPMRHMGIDGAEQYCAGDPIHFSRSGSEAMGRKLAESLLASQPIGAQPLAQPR